MFIFLQTLLAALIAAMLAPYFSQFLANKKTKREETLKSTELILWIKNEKLKIESELTPFHFAYWKNLANKLWRQIKKFIAKIKTKKYGDK